MNSASSSTVADMVSPVASPCHGDAVKLVEVGPRDGLQNEKNYPDLVIRAELINRLVASGLRHIEAGSFVSPQRVPAMAGTADLLQMLPPLPGVSLPVLVPNQRGLEQALAAGCQDIAVFLSASEGFSQRNIQCSIAESQARYGEVIRAALGAGVRVRGYVSCVVRCPYDGDVSPAAVVKMAEWLALQGCTEISLGDTIGAATPAHVTVLLETCRAVLPLSMLAGHFHDTYGMAVANVLAALECGIRTFDASVAGLGGCPYARGATGNVATEDVVYLLHGMGMHTGVNLPLLMQAGQFISQHLGRNNGSAVGRALLGA